jgi:hypothetical protein
MPKSIWTIEMESQNGESRICEMSTAKRTLFAVACVTHADARVREATGIKDIQELAPWSKIIKEFWAGFPNTATGTLRESLERKVTKKVQELAGTGSDEHIMQAPGAEQLMWATLYALASDQPNDPGSCNAYSSASASYQSVFTVYAESPFATFEQQTVEERKTQQSFDEIRFQLELLRVVESVDELCCYEELIRRGVTGRAEGFGAEFG